VKLGLKDTPELEDTESSVIKLAEVGVEWSECIKRLRQRSAG
jgi:hypothetical protein